MDQKQAATKGFQRQQQQISEANTEQDRIRLANSAAESTAAIAVAAGSAEAASFFMGVDGPEGAALWDALPEAAKTQMYKDKIAAEDTQGLRWNAGSYANMVGKYGENNSSHILHAEHMVGMDEAQRKGYIENLQTESMMSGAAMDADDIGRINLFYAEIDAANQTVQAANRITADEIAREQNKDRVAPNYTLEEIQRMVAEAPLSPITPGGGATGTAAAPQTTLSPEDPGFDWSTSKAGWLAKELAGIVGFGPKA